MHPYVYKKHKPQQLIALVILYCIMILCQPVNSSSACNYSVKKIKIYSPFTKGHVRIENNIVNATICRGTICNSEKSMEKNYLYKVTIDRYYLLLYHIHSKKFICWNRHFRKLVAKKNPTNLTYCKFEETVSKIRGNFSTRYITPDEKNREVEIRFNKSGAFAKPRMIERCVKKHNGTRLVGLSPKHFANLDPSRIEEGSKEWDAYLFLRRHCASPGFITKPVEDCVSGLPEFCRLIKEGMNNGRSITTEIMELCRHEWNRNYY